VSRAGRRSRRMADTATLSLFDVAAETALASASPGEARPPADTLDPSVAALAEGFAEHVVRWAEQGGAPSSSLGLLRSAAFAASVATASGHACTYLREIAAATPDIDALRDALRASTMVGDARGSGSEPLVLDDDGRLYLRRYFEYERRIASRLREGVPHALDAAHEARLRARLDALFGAASTADDEVDWQKVAAALAVMRPVTVISGGPGTGKTTTVVALLACLLDLEPECRIALAAPTGKAAARLQDALRHRAAALPPNVQERLPKESFTLHRLLGGTPSSPDFLHNASNPLPYDAVVIDEASMLDLALASKLFDAVPPSARIILLGDKDQLAAVESGAVFSELSADPTLRTPCVARLARVCGVEARSIATPQPTAPSTLQDAVVWFTRNFRFDADSGIARLAQTVKEGDAERTIAWLRARGDPTIEWLEDDARVPGVDAVSRLMEGYASYLAALQTDAGDASTLLDAFDRFRVLCAQRKGSRGVQGLNDIIGQHCRSAMERAWPSVTRSPWYAGRPVMVLRNDYVLKLYNGDIGIALPDADGNLLVHFRDDHGSTRAIAPMRLPEHETAFATTVHKAQGSEFDAVALVLPATESRVLTRELVYTAVTRARRKVILVAGAPVLASAMRTPTVRHSGLIARLAETVA